MHKTKPTDPDMIALWEAASQCEIGIRIEWDGPVDSYLNARLAAARPPGYEDYCLAIPSEQNCYYIVKPGVTLD